MLRLLAVPLSRSLFRLAGRLHRWCCKSAFWLVLKFGTEADVLTVVNSQLAPVGMRVMTVSDFVALGGQSRPPPPLPPTMVN